MEARCPRCGARIDVPVRRQWRSRTLVAALALAALILYPVSMYLPVLEVRKLGHIHSATIWSGVVELLSAGQVAVGLLILVCSIIIPLVKIAGLLVLSSSGSRPHFAGLSLRAKVRVHRAIDGIGRWGMVDVLLVAILVAAVKLGSWVSVHPGPGIGAFAAVVALSLAASAAFDPRFIWEEEPA
jgi:paraquat-inducible protein A